jgi:hypothetical protein
MAARLVEGNAIELPEAGTGRCVVTPWPVTLVPSDELDYRERPFRFRLRPH